MYKVSYSRLYYKYYVKFYKIYIALDFRVYNQNVDYLEKRILL